MNARFATLTAAAVLLGAASAQAAELTLTFRNLQAAQGAVMVGVYDSAESYTRGRPVRAVQMAATGGEVVARVEGLSPGRYAVKAFHDLDGDGDMDVNPFGLPTEPFAFSNDAPADMGPPTFEAAAFEVPEGGAALTVSFR